MPVPLFPAFDVAIEPVSAATGFNPLPVFAVVFVAEALVLWLVRWGSLGRSAVASLVMNTVTTVLGVLLSLSGREALVVSFPLNLVVEGVVLMAFNWRNKARLWAAALAANVASLLLLLALYFVGRSLF